MNQHPRAVLWDMDGTLVDTEPYWMDAETDLIESFGGTWSHEQALQLVGNGLIDSAIILQGAGVKMGAQEIVDELTERVRVRLQQDGVPFRPGARELLRELRAAGVPTALVTMSLRRMAEDIVSLIGFDAFDVIVGGDDVERPKPFPDPYLQAADALGIDIADAVALEDSPTGLQSALSARAVAIGVPHIVELDGLGADALWKTLSGRGVDDVAAEFARARSIRTEASL
ncbi:HAD family phosphatase [Microbacterium sp. USTB-Y]|uniref:HAD family hydrolase n=1 Tax=Microbacterium sp. USTB-Y TaxID=2823692 RepID=UPI0027E32B82|nr:HAD family phosphatase [Microbacterium sp. USTB-Y]